jgi:hypothetical protein
MFSGNSRGHHCQPDRRPGIGFGQRRPVGAHPLPQCFDEHREQRQQQKQQQEQQRQRDQGDACERRIFQRRARGDGLTGHGATSPRIAAG